MKRIAVIIVISFLFAGCSTIGTDNPVINAIGKIFADPPATKGGTVSRGMTMGQVVAEWGEPYRVNRSVGSCGVSEQWVYVSRRYSGNHPRFYLYFKNAELASWQDMRR